jgi:transposase-like protein
MLVLIGATRDGRKELVAVVDGFCENKQSWYELLLDLKSRGLATAPKVAVGDGALGFWAALREVLGETFEQRCWFHKTGNILNRMPKSVQPKAKGDIHEIWMAEHVSLTMMFKLAKSAEKKWRRLNGHEQIITLLEGKKFVNGELQEAAA